MCAEKFVTEVEQEVVVLLVFMVHQRKNFELLIDDTGVLQTGLRSEQKKKIPP